MKDEAEKIRTTLDRDDCAGAAGFDPWSVTLPGPTEMTSTGFWTEVTQLQGWSLINFGLERTPQIWRAVERLYTISRENYARAPQAL